MKRKKIRAWRLFARRHPSYLRSVITLADSLSVQRLILGLRTDSPVRDDLETFFSDTQIIADFFNMTPGQAKRLGSLFLGYRLSSLELSGNARSTRNSCARLLLISLDFIFLRITYKP